MHKIALEPEEPYSLSAGGSGTDVEESHLECRDHTGG
jgi:hypothetical protein